MHINTPRASFHKALGLSLAAAANSSPLQIYRSVLLSADSEMMIGITYNGELGFRVPTASGLDVLEAGGIAVPAKILSEITGSLDGETLSLKTDDRDTLHIKCGKSEFMLSGEPADQFPLLPEPTDGARIDMTVGQLKDITAAVSRSVSNDEGRPILTGVHFVLGADGLRCASTDTHRLHIFHNPDLKASPEGASAEANSVIPGEAMTQIARFLASQPPENPVVLTLSSRQARFSFPAHDITIISKLIEGQFPDYMRVVPESFDHVIMLDRVAAMKAVKRVGVISSRETSNRIVVTLDGHVLSLKAETGGIGWATESVDLPTPHAGAPIVMAFNAAYLLDALSGINTPIAQMNIGAPLTPCLIHAEGELDHKHILMPMQVAE